MKVIWPDDIPMLIGKSLDDVALLYGLKRKKYLFIFKERDNRLKKRILTVLCNPAFYTEETL